MLTKPPLRLRDFRGELNFIIVIFLFSLCLGLLSYQTPPQFIAELVQELTDIVATLSGASVMDVFSFIFVKNVLAVVSVIIGGILFGISPVLSAVLNGFLIGIVSGQAIASEGFRIIIAGIVPHGIFELPALFLALALGLRLGKLLWELLRGNRNPKLSWWQRLEASIKLLLGELWRSLMYAWRIIIPLLALAALIESTATPALLDYVINYL